MVGLHTPVVVKPLANEGDLQVEAHQGYERLSPMQDDVVHARALHAWTVVLHQLVALFHEVLHEAELLHHFLAEEDGNSPAENRKDDQRDSHGTLQKNWPI